MTCVPLGDQHIDQDKRRRLAEAVSARRAQLGRAQEAMPAHGGPSGRTVRAIEQVQLASFTDNVLAKLDRGLDWRSGQAARILSGEADEAEIKQAIGTHVVTVAEIRRRIANLPPQTPEAEDALRHVLPELFGDDPKEPE